MFEKEIEKKFSDSKTLLKKRAMLPPFFKQISILRKYLSMSQRQLAKRTGLKQPVIANIESGKQNISIDYLKIVAEGLNCDVQVFLTPKEPLSIIKEAQIERAAKKILDSTLNNASLEGQFFSKTVAREQFNILKEEFRKNPKKIWDV